MRCNCCAALFVAPFHDIGNAQVGDGQNGQQYTKGTHVEGLNFNERMAELQAKRRILDDAPNLIRR